MLCVGVELRRFGRIDRYVTFTGFGIGVVCSVWFLSVLLIVTSALCCRLYGVMKFVVMVGFEGKAYPFG